MNLDSHFASKNAIKNAVKEVVGEPSALKRLMAENTFWPNLIIDSLTEQSMFVTGIKSKPDVPRRHPKGDNHAIYRSVVSPAKAPRGEIAHPSMWVDTIREFNKLFPGVSKEAETLAKHFMDLRCFCESTHMKRVESLVKAPPMNPKEFANFGEKKERTPDYTVDGVEYWIDYEPDYHRKERKAEREYHERRRQLANKDPDEMTYIDFLNMYQIGDTHFSVRSIHHHGVRFDETPYVYGTRKPMDPFSIQRLNEVLEPRLMDAFLRRNS